MVSILAVAIEEVDARTRKIRAGSDFKIIRTSTRTYEQYIHTYKHINFFPFYSLVWGLPQLGPKTASEGLKTTLRRLKLKTFMVQTHLGARGLHQQDPHPLHISLQKMIGCFDNCICHQNCNCDVVLRNDARLVPCDSHLWAMQHMWSTARIEICHIVVTLILLWYQHYSGISISHLPGSWLRSPH